MSEGTKNKYGTPPSLIAWMNAAKQDEIREIYQLPNEFKWRTKIKKKERT